MSATRLNVPAYPLAWPEGWKRTTARVAAPFFKKRGERRENISISEAVDEVELELQRLKAGRDSVISTNVKPTLRGSYNTLTPDNGDPGAAVYFTLRDQGRCLACDRFTRVPDNLVAIAKRSDGCGWTRHVTLAAGNAGTATATVRRGA